MALDCSIKSKLQENVGVSPLKPKSILHTESKFMADTLNRQSQEKASDKPPKCALSKEFNSAPPPPPPPPPLHT